MEYKKMGRRIVLRLDQGEELLSCVTEVCQAEHVPAALVSGIGFTTEMRVRVFDKDEKRFLFQTLRESMEIVSLTGNVLQTERGLFAHLHIMAADRSMRVRGGHLVHCTIGATGELVLDVLEEPLWRGNSDELHLGEIFF